MFLILWIYYQEVKFITTGNYNDPCDSKLINMKLIFFNIRCILWLKIIYIFDKLARIFFVAIIDKT